jgi:hypothetical protein
VLIAAGSGRGSSAGDWAKLGIVVAAALALSFLAFVWSARSRT